MKNGNEPSSKVTGWTATQAYIMAVVCLLVGMAGGYLVRGSGASDDGAGSGTAAQMPASANLAPTGQITPQQLKEMADKQAQPLLQQLKSNPNDAALLANAGNIYYDAHVFDSAISYYQQALKIEPANTNVRTDLGTAYWYQGDADKAMSEFKTVLSAEPNKASALMNLGIVQWQGKMDANGAIASWQKLLKTNPSFAERDKVEMMIANARKHMNVKPGTTTDKPM